MLDATYKGVRGEQTSDQDYQLGGALVLPIARNTFDSSGKIQYFQAENECTVYGPMGSVSALTGYKFTSDDQTAIWKAAEALGANNVTGGYINNGVDVVCKYYNSLFQKDPLIYFRIDVGGPDWNTVINKGYSPVIGFQGNNAYNEDYMSDDILDGVTFKPALYGHCVHSNGTDLVYDQVDDSFQNGTNLHQIYKIPKVNIAALVSNNVFFKSAYVFCYASDYNNTQSMSNISPWAVASINKAELKGITIPDPKRIVAIPEVETIYKQLGYITTDTGQGLTLERFLVVLDRQHLLD